MTDLKPFFITTNRPYQEGTVEIFTQPVPETKNNWQKAFLTITALGLYEAELDGEKIGEALFTPGYTYYPRRLNVQTYDLTDRLSGKKALTVYLGQGWYCGRFTCDNKTAIYGERPAAAWVLELTDADGTVKRITSRDDDVSALASPYTYAGLYDGEIYTPSAPQPPFPPIPYTGPLPETFSPSIIKTCLQEQMPVRAITKSGDAVILDFGQNFAGILEINPIKMKGKRLRLRHGERLNPDGSLYTANLRRAKAEIIYEKDGERIYRPRFTYMGFRYVELSGVPYAEGLIRARVLHTEMERTGTFSCQNEKVERLYLNQLWSQRSNYIEIPTDCPQRDERMGYTGDGHVFARTGAYNYDTEAFWCKFLQDIRDSQKDNTEGYVAPTIPALGKAGIGFLSMLGWGSAVTIIPELLHKQYGEERYLREQYESMKAHVDCEIRHMGGLIGKKDLWISPSLGDWLTLGKDVKYMAMHNGPVSNAFIVNDLRILSETAARFGKTEDSTKYSEQLFKTRTAYQNAFIKKDGSGMKDDYQGAYVLALKMVIEPGTLWNQLFVKLVEKLRCEGMQTGFFATQHLLPLLVEHGEKKLAYDLLLQPNCPGWIYQIDRGATTSWERWDALLPDGSVNESRMNGNNMVSFNHYAFGSVGEFYYRYILGLQEAEPGFKRLRFAPCIDQRLGSVSGSYRSRSGEFRTGWKTEGGRAVITLATPVEAEVFLPGKKGPEIVAPGEYRFEAACE